jgi:arylamine N-acetyltransferase
VSATFSRYLRILGCKQREPSHDALAELVAAHLTRIKFENISKLHYLQREGLKGIPGLEQYLEGVESFGFGGTCYSNNYYLHCLLDHLGYDVSLCGADMSEPDVHLVNLVHIDGRELLVDVGYAAPFISPLPRDLDHEHEVVLGHDRYVLSPREAGGRSSLSMHREGTLKHGYTINPTPRGIDHFSTVIEDSFRRDATFMNALLIVRFDRGSALRLHNYTLTKMEGVTARTRALKDRDELIGVIEGRFGIDTGIATPVVDAFGDLTGDAWN